MPHLSRQEIEVFEPDAHPGPGLAALDQARRAIEEAGYWNANQQMGRRWPIGCVALEITQRCNLDCALCYLSENSEAVHDLPLEEVFRRIELIHRYYGRNTDVQITGGDPTLRKRDELLAIVRKVRSLEMRPTLMTNGIRATRTLLEDLAAAGLVDVSFHVDTAQRRKGYASEVELNEIRQAYIDRARGLPLSVFFSATLHQGNFHEIPDLVRFFKANIGVVRTVSFQLAADTGRGVHGMRGLAITPQSVARKIEIGAGTSVNFQASLIGHPACTRFHVPAQREAGQLHPAADQNPGSRWRKVLATAERRYHAGCGGFRRHRSATARAEAPQGAGPATPARATACLTRGAQMLVSRAAGEFMKALMWLAILSLATFIPLAVSQERDADALGHWAGVLSDVIRPMGDERVHFALNCMAVGCPRLPKSPFTASALNEQLDREARRFFGEPRNLQLAPARKTVRLSELLKFYTEDFQRRSPGLIAYVNQYAREKIPEDYAVDFIDYDWTVNSQSRTAK